MVEKGGIEVEEEKMGGEEKRGSEKKNTEWGGPNGRST